MMHDSTFDAGIIYVTNIYAKNNDYNSIIDKYQDTELDTNLLIDSTLNKNVLPVSPSAQKSNLLSEALFFSEINKTYSDSVIGNDFTMNSILYLKVKIVF